MTDKLVSEEYLHFDGERLSAPGSLIMPLLPERPTLPATVEIAPVESQIKPVGEGTLSYQDWLLDQMGQGVNVDLLVNSGH
ncbi:hypothetical protein A2160_00640 [Candidatus Beckwithbacteria bacterium RBG_13_42_9]|uniref:Uncharacterized protein n=1 Tax=Candidatus Beckwithbacteria bacterium RBG_13_42_9 TaxID=1797457 RepID=A0A1F5E4N9_9BACT|nr:MAG: hypothetical protein A2160_00640 [Candidatus Beckwithbacteria bacterium RBG_13_42_9]